MMKLGALNGISVAIVPDESEGSSEPIEGLGEIRVGDVRKHSIDGNGAVPEHGGTIRRTEASSNGVRVVEPGMNRER